MYKWGENTSQVKWTLAKVTFKNIKESLWKPYLSLHLKFVKKIWINLGHFFFLGNYEVTSNCQKDSTSKNIAVKYVYHAK